MKTLVNVTNDKKDLVRAGNAVKGFKDIKGEKVKITGAIIYQKEEVDEKTGEVVVKNVSCIKTSDGEFYTSISPTVENSLSLTCEACSEEILNGGLDVEIKAGTSNGGREFLYIDLA